MPEQRNVLFIIIDQLRADCLDGALARHVDLPNLQAFSADAVAFQRHFSVINPCGPARASILTGQYGMNHRSVRNGAPLRHDTPNIATEMRKAGYLPMLFGYTDTSQDPRIHNPKDPGLQTYEYPMPGFHEMVEMRRDQSFPWRGYLKSKGYKFGDYTELSHPVSPDGGAAKIDDPALYKAEDSDTAYLTNRFLETIPGYEGQCWCAHLTYIRPHPPFLAPAPYNQMYDAADLPYPNRYETEDEERALHPFMGPGLDHYSAANTVVGFPDLEENDENIQKLRAIYLGLVTEVDHHIGRVIAQLKASGEYDNTMIVITSDHGEMLGNHHTWGKMSVYDAAYHVPLLIRAPGMKPGVVTKPTEAIDIAPTILDWIGQDIPNSMDGRSLMPFLRGENPPDWRNATFSELDIGQPITPTHWQEQLDIGISESSLSILREDRFTLIEFAADLPPILFDHDGAGEFTNVAEYPDFAAELLRMTRAMLRHRMKHMDHTLSLTEITNEGPKARHRFS